MKKVLFATTALVLTAGVAAAEVAVSGDARMGLRYESDNNYTGDSSWNVVNRMRVHFTMTGESQSGISFGVKLRSDQKSNSGDNASATAGEVWVSGAYGKLTVGDIDSALESAVGDLPEVGVSSLDFWNEFAYSGSEEDGFGDAGILYEYAIGNANLYLSLHDKYAGNSDVEHDSTSWSVGVGYDLGNYTFGLGYEKSGYTLNPLFDNLDGAGAPADKFLSGFESDTWGISGGTVIGGFTLKAAYLATETDDPALTDWDQYGLGVEYDMANGVALKGFYRMVDLDNGNEAKAIGLGANYDLGGGATLKGGIVRATSDGFALQDNTLADFGLEFKF